ncbi:MAG: nucleotidyltransferase domain-containing protein [Thermodesulfobacteriota bacterium]
MRLKPEQIKNIREAVLNKDPNARVYLFGSRLDDNQKGGDIDLLVVSQKLTGTDRRRIKLELYRSLGPRKIDIVLAQNDAKAFVQQVLDQGTAL